MILTRIYDVTLNVTNPINFCTNKKAHVLIELNNYYTNKCFMGSFIIEILDILQMSSCRIVSSNSTANATIDVKFSAKVFVLSTWDILVGIEIEKNSSLVTGKYKQDSMVIHVSFTPTNLQANMLNIGQIVPVRVVKSIHRPKESDISVAAVLLTCDRKNVYYKVKGEISKQYLPDIQELLSKIITELNRRKEITKKNILMFFESLLYSYRDCPASAVTRIDNHDTEWEGPTKAEPAKAELNKADEPKGKLFTIFDLLGMDLTGYWTRPLNVCRSSPFVSMTATKPAEYFLTAPHLLVTEFMTNILTFLVATRELTETYDDALIKSHENIWNIMRKNQSL
jgi:hypothetical protein